MIAFIHIINYCNLLFQVNECIALVFLMENSNQSVLTAKYLVAVGGKLFFNIVIAGLCHNTDTKSFAEFQNYKYKI